MTYEIIAGLITIVSFIITIVTVFVKNNEKTINALNQLKIEISTNNANLLNLTNTINNLISKTDNQEQHLNGLDLKVQSLEQKINELEHKVDKLESKVNP